VALEKFAKPYYDELKLNRLRKLAEEKNKITELTMQSPKQKKPEPKVNYAELLGVKGNLDKPKSSDLYNAALKKNFEDEIENMEVDKKIINSNNYKEEISKMNKSKLDVIF
jgi:hypothetical protein